ncbi:MAG: CBS domain-containing protein [Polyangiaceae bacterium]
MTLERYIRPVVEAALGTSVIEAARVMREKRVGCLVVVREGRPVGVVTDRDLALRVLAEGRDPRTSTVADIVTYDPIVVGVGDALETALEKMRVHGVRRLPIVSSEGKVVGVVTADDVMMSFGRGRAQLAQGHESASDVTESR